MVTQLLVQHTTYFRIVLNVNMTYQVHHTDVDLKLLVKPAVIEVRVHVYTVVYGNYLQVAMLQIGCEFSILFKRCITGRFRTVIFFQMSKFITPLFCIATIFCFMPSMLSINAKQLFSGRTDI